MNFTLFSKKNKADTKKLDYSEKGVLAAFNTAFMKMQQRNVERLVISVRPFEESKEKSPGGWVDNKYCQYYPDEMLTRAELSHQSAKGAHQVIALVSATNPVMKRDGASVEVVDRHPRYFFSIVNPDRFLNSPSVFIGQAQIAGLAKANSEQKVVSAEEILGAAEAGIAEYGEITRRLMEKAGVYAALEKLENAKFATQAERLLEEVRQAISVSRAR